MWKLWKAFKEKSEIKDRVLDYKKKEKMILYAKQLCSVSNKKSKITIILSSYETKNIKYAPIYVATH
ncbi:hypothetical protein LPTSP2_08190 [Leptospira ellinghausenii]|uniref:Uncharacterized protein n=1 Tax=Leptospira ellinghausenii TaxID=1917822 RepID=A0A2P2DA75_9LEPT|nr:hypothetical protein LPTSP2_08190 [Leptospira ellinghausenii]